MKIFKPLLLTAIFTCFYIAESNAFTSQILHETPLNNIEFHNALSASDFLNLTSQNPLLVSEVSAAAVEYASVSQENLNYLYFVCMGLVLINLIAQIKIIYQMIHLFFQFRKKDEVGHLSI